MPAVGYEQPGYEPGTSQLPVECFSTELLHLLNFVSILT